MAVYASEKEESKGGWVSAGKTDEAQRWPGPGQFALVIFQRATEQTQPMLPGGSSREELTKAEISELGLDGCIGVFQGRESRNV